MIRTVVIRSRLTAWALATVCVTAAFGAVLLSIGCGGKRSSSENFGHEVSLAPTQDHLSLAMGFFRRFDEFDPDQARRQVLDNLNSWAEEQPPDPKWQPDPLVARLPSPWREFPDVRNLSKLEFDPEDIDLLQEQHGRGNVSRWVVEQPLEPWLASRLPRPADGLDKADIDRLAVALRLFDWTIRNVQLDELLPAPKTDAAGPATDAKQPQTTAKPPPFQGVPGPGYRQHPWQTMLMGRGDAWQRAHVFILLCRQEGLDAVMLGLVEGAPTSPPKPWLPALLIRDQLYLFDTALGLPLPGPAGKGIATLARAVAEPQVLQQLDLDEEHPYAVKAESLGQVVALIDATPGYLSRRMQLAEARLAGDERMVISVAPTKLKEKLARLKGVSSVQLWILPYETLAYRAAYLQLITVSREAYDNFWREEGPFQLQPGITNTLVRARYQHFRGIFDVRDQRDRESQDGASSQDSGREKPGALAFYLGARMPDEEIARVEGSEALQIRIWPKFEGESPDSYAGRRKAMLSVIRPTRQNAAYWIGLSHYEHRNYPAAIDWLQHRTLEANPDGLWSDGARYNLARCHEALGDLSAARQIYYGDESPQRHGNHIRADLLDEPAK